MTKDSVSDWLENASKYPLLSAAEEITLGTQVQRSQKDDATAAEKRVGKRAHKRMLLSNLRLVVNIAKKHNVRIKRSNALFLEDLLQAGTLGLDTAVKKFDPERGFKFSTYAYWWVVQAVTREIQYFGTTIRIPATQTGAMTKLRFKPDDQSLEEFAEEHGYEMKQVEMALYSQNICSPVSLDLKRVGVESDLSTLGDLVADPNQETIDDLDKKLAVEQLERLADLDDLALVELELDGARIKELSSLLGVGFEQGKDEIKAAKIRLRSVVVEHRELVA